MALTKVHNRLIDGSSVNVKDFGAVGDGVTDDTAAIQAAIDHVDSSNAQAGVQAILFPSGTYIVSSSLSVSATTFKAFAEGTARLQPSSLTAGTTYAIFNFTSCEFLELEGFSFYMFGSNAKGIGGKVWRQARISNCYFIGGYGVDMATGTDIWGTGIYDCRFNDCVTGLNLDINGQTFHVEKCLFFNSSVSDFEITGSIASQVKFQTCVFESGGANRPVTCIVENVDEIAFDSCQSERLYTSGNSDTKASYDMQFTNSKVLVVNSRFWGGGWGSSAPGNSREYGLYLDNTTISILSSRIFSFRESAITGANNSRLICDLSSQLDYKIKGDLYIESSCELGHNLIQNGAFERFRNDASGVMPFSWDASGGSPARVTTGLLGKQSVAGLEITDGNLYDTNEFYVDENQPILIRFFYKHVGGPGARCFVYDADTTTLLYTVKTNDLNLAGNTDQSGLICDTFVIPSGTQKCFIRFVKNASTTSIQIEEVAVYLARGTQTASTVYSDNDGSFGFYGTFAPAIPYKSNTKYTHSAAPLVDTWSQGEVVQNSNPTVDGNNMVLSHWVCTTGGTPGTWSPQYLSTVSPAT